MAVGAEVERELRELRAVAPPQHELGVGGIRNVKLAHECRVHIAQPNQLAKPRDDGPAQRGEHLIVIVVVAIDIAADAGAPKQLDVVAAGQQADIVDLRIPGTNAARRARSGTSIVTRERVIERTVHLV